MLTETEAPFARRRTLTAAEIDTAMALLGEGAPLWAAAQGLRVTPGTLRAQLLDAAWDAWCVVQEVTGVERPE